MAIHRRALLQGAVTAGAAGALGSLAPPASAQGAAFPGVVLDVLKAPEGAPPRVPWLAGAGLHADGTVYQLGQYADDVASFKYGAGGFLVLDRGRDRLTLIRREGGARVLAEDVGYGYSVETGTPARARVVIDLDDNSLRCIRVGDGETVREFSYPVFGRTGFFGPVAFHRDEVWSERSALDEPVHGTFLIKRMSDGSDRRIVVGPGVEPAGVRPDLGLITTQTRDYYTDIINQREGWSTRIHRRGLSFSPRGTYCVTSVPSALWREVYETRTGRLLQRWESPDNLLVRVPTWESETQLLQTVTQRGRTALVRLYTYSRKYFRVTGLRTEDRQVMAIAADGEVD